jgi:hypothetical protein
MIDFPAGERQRIRKPVHFLERRESSPSSLEAALLLIATLDAAHKDGVDPALVLVVGPADEGGGTAKTTFVAWRFADEAWRALDLRLASELDFKANTAAASPRVATLLAASPKTLRAVYEDSAAFSEDRRIAVVDFAHVPVRYRIRGLP